MQKKMSCRFFQQVDCSTDPATTPRPATTTTASTTARTLLLPPTGCPSVAYQARYGPRLISYEGTGLVFKADGDSWLSSLGGSEAPPIIRAYE